MQPLTIAEQSNILAMRDHYIATMLWASIGDGDEFLDASHDQFDMAPVTLQRIESDCAAFYRANRDAIYCEGAPLANDFEGSIAHRTAAMAGHDFWLTRCGLGAGFWDGNWPEPYATQLTESAQSFGALNPYAGDDGLIYF